MPFQPGAVVNTQAFGNRAENVEVPHYDVRAPAATDILHPVGKIWVYQGVAAYILLGLSSLGGTTTANWSQIISADSSGNVSINGNLSLTTAGNKINIATGTNASVGTSSAMTAGTIVVNTTAVTANSIIFVSYNTLAGTTGSVSAPSASRVPGTSFTITSSSNTDTSTVNWWIVN